MIDLAASRDLAHLPDGVSAQAAVYTDHFAHVSVMRKVPVMRRSPGNCRREWLAVPL
jgi:hypothetical protein